MSLNIINVKSPIAIPSELFFPAIENNALLADFQSDGITIKDKSGIDESRLPRNLACLNSDPVSHSILLPLGNFAHSTTDNFTIFFEFKSVEAAAVNIIASNEDWGVSYKGIRIHHNSGGALLVDFYTALAVSALDLATGSFTNIQGTTIVTGTRDNLNDGEWHRIALTYSNDGTFGISRVNLYVDDALSGKVNFIAGADGDIVSPTDWRLGGRPTTNATEHENMSFSRSLFYNEVKSHEDIIRIGGGEIVTQGLQRYYTGQEEDGAIVYNNYVTDYLNPYHGSITGASPNTLRVNDGIRSYANRYGYTESGIIVIPVNLADKTKDIAENTPTFFGRVIWPVTVNSISPISFDPNPNGYDELNNLGLTNLTTITASSVEFQANESKNPLFKNSIDTRFVICYRVLRHFIEYNGELDELKDVLNPLNITTYLFAQVGQSNMVGTNNLVDDDFTDLTYKDIVTGAYMSDNNVAVASIPTVNMFEIYESDINGKGSLFGPDASFMKDLRDANKTVYLFKYAIGSTSLLPSALNYWHPTDAGGAGTQIYPFFINGLRQTINILKEAGRNVEVILWQAPHESNRSATEVVYTAALQAFFDSFTTDIPQFNGKYLTWRGHTTYFDALGLSETRAAVVNFVALDPDNRAWHDTDLYATHDADGVHFTIAGQEDNGQDSAANVLLKNWLT